MNLLPLFVLVGFGFVGNRRKRKDASKHSIGLAVGAVGVVLLLLNTGCLAKDTMLQDDNALEDCLCDLWQQPRSVECLCGNGTPECAVGDCQSHGYLLLREESLAIEGFYRSSEQLKIFGSHGVPQESEYIVDSGTLSVTADGRIPGDVQCSSTSEEMVWKGRRWIRAPQQIQIL